MASFTGVERRFDFKIKTDEVVFLSDYAHHPAELKQSITSMRQLYPDRRLTGIFQPHLYTRTRDFYMEFAQSLSLLDEVILTDIYPAREKPIEGISSQIIYDNLRPDISKMMCRKEELPKLFETHPVDVLMVLGAGDVEDYVKPIEEVLLQRTRKI
jgi:UDP-N-acetylmuramate--alanine ligase